MVSSYNEVILKDVEAATMTIGNYLIEISRQLWASLTGGWYYDPKNSIFCNTIHLYIWILLLILPLLFSFIASNDDSSYMLCVYVGFIMFLFTLLKIVVGYLHTIFDTAEPIITHKSKKSTNISGPIISPISSFSGARGTESNVIEMAELGTEQNQILRKSLDASLNENLSCFVDLDIVLSEQRDCTDNSLPSYEDGLSSDAKTCPNFKDEYVISANSNVSVNANRSSLRRISSGLIGNNKGTFGKRLKRSESSGILLFTDSLELLPLNNASNSFLTNTKYSRRKYSDPSSMRCFQLEKKQNIEKSNPFVIRRVQSSSETHAQNLQRITPSKSENLRVLKNRKSMFVKNDNKISILNRKNQSFNNLSENLIQKKNYKIKQNNPDEPCCSKDLQRKLNYGIDINNLTTNLKSGEVELLVKSYKPVSLTLNKTLNQISGENNDSQRTINDLKGEITKFLEELIEKHPETLDAIENVRKNRMGRTLPCGTFGEVTLAPETVIVTEQTNLNDSQIYDIYHLNLKDGTHVAYAHEDTTQGAVHSFQDEHGNWWTYAFDEQSSGTAQALGSNRTISEMFNKRRETRLSDTKVESNKKTSPFNYRQTSQILSAYSNFFSAAKFTKEIKNSNYRSRTSSKDKKNELNLLVGPSSSSPLLNNLESKHNQNDCLPSTSTSVPISYLNLIANKNSVLKKSNNKKSVEIFDAKTIPYSNQTVLSHCSSIRRFSLPQNVTKLLKENNPKTFVSLCSSSSSNSSERCYQKPISSSSSSDASDYMEFSKYISNKPTNIFYPVNNVQPEKENHFQLNVENRQYFHRRHKSDSSGIHFMSFLNMASRLYNQSANIGLNNESDFISKNDELRSLSYKCRSATSTNANLQQSQNLISIMQSNDSSRKKNHRNRRHNNHTRIRASLQSSSTALPHIFDNSINVSNNLAGIQTPGRFSRLESYSNDMMRRLIVTNMRSNDLLLQNNVRCELPNSTICDNLINATTDNIFGGRVGLQTNVPSSRRHLRSLSSIRITNDIQSMDFSPNCLRKIGTYQIQNRTKVSYYYKIKLIPRPFSMSEGFRIKIDRLSLSALFDRNNLVFSAFIDIILAGLISFLSAKMIMMNVYSDFYLLLFALVIAGSQFSLLKSVQPDAASPVHGFNWLITYSRPVYFCILTLLYLLIDILALKFGKNRELIESTWLQNENSTSFIFCILKSDENILGNINNDIGWYWAPIWLNLYSRTNFFFSFKELVSTTILFLPLAFTFGLLPQVDTLAMHFIEQLDVHLFGATASFSLTSSLFSFFRNIIFVAILSIFGYFTHEFGLESIQNMAFSAFIALSISMAFVASRWSSNPLVTKIIFNHLKQLATVQMPKQYKRRRQNVSRQLHNKNFESTSYLSSVVSSPDTPFIKSLCCTAKFSEKSCVQLKNSSVSAYNFSSKEIINSNVDYQQKVTLEDQSIQNYVSLKPLSQKKSSLGENIVEPKNFDTKLEITHAQSKNSAQKVNIQSTGDEIKLEKKIEITPENQNTINKESKKKKNNNSYAKNLDFMPNVINECIKNRLYYDIFYFVLNTFILFGLHSTSLFTSTNSYFETIIFALYIFFGFCNNYIYPQLRTHTPWKFFAQPILKSNEFHQYETTVEAKLMGFEIIHFWMIFFEKTILNSLLVMSLISTQFQQKTFFAAILTSLCGFRIARSGFSHSQLVYIPLTITFVFSLLGFVDSSISDSNGNLTKLISSKFLLLYLLIAIWPKIQEFILKMNFIFVYIAPWQISWGSAFHAFAQPFSVPHTGLIFAQAAISSLLSAPLNPFLGSSFFLMSYIRPIKFWEKDYNTKRTDHSSLRLISQLDRGPMVDDSNLNSIFYEHLTRSLQKSLAGDLLLGRWATSVEQGDCFILASLYLNCLVHIIEVGNGFVTFQVRGLEFRGTYCHQREVEAISEDWSDGGGCCCCTIGKLPGLLSFNNAWSLRWLAWEVVTAKYVIDGYSITDNSAVNLLQVHELRLLLITLYVKCIIFYAMNSLNFEDWLLNETILKALEPIKKNSRYVESDQMFCPATDEDYDLNLLGISKQRFIDLYGEWIEHCLNCRRNNSKLRIRNLMVEGVIDLNLVTCFSFLLSILGRRALGTASFNRHASSAESFLFGLHALFKGDMRITSPSDEWVFSDPEILTRVISPSVRMSLKLHQDHFAVIDEFDDMHSLYNRISLYHKEIFISHEHDPKWREAIISNTPSLLALRHIFDDGQDDYKIIMLNKMHLNMRVIKLNRECVRAFWSGQQQELIFFRNCNPERGSIQNARQVLRNMINSSADQPIGYPIFVSPLVTSFIEMHSQIETINFGKPITFCIIFQWICRMFCCLRKHFGTSGSSNLSSSINNNIVMLQQNPILIPSSSTAQLKNRRSGSNSSYISNKLTSTTPAPVLTNAPVVGQAGSTPAPYRKNQSISLVLS